MFIQDKSEELLHNLRCLHCFLCYGREETEKAIYEKFNLKRNELYNKMPLFTFLLQNKFNPKIFTQNHLPQFFELFIPSLNIISYELSNTAFDLNIEKKKRIKARKKIGKLISDIIEYIFEQNSFLVFKDCNRGFAIKGDNIVKVVHLDNLIGIKNLKIKNYFISEHFSNGVSYLTIKDSKNDKNCTFKVRIKNIKKFSDFCPVKTLKQYKHIYARIMDTLIPKNECPLCYSRTYRRHRCCEECNYILAQFVKFGNRSRSQYYDVIAKTNGNDIENTKRLRKEKLLKEADKIIKCNKNPDILLELTKIIKKSFS